MKMETKEHSSVFLTAVRLQNCQAWTDVTLPFSKDTLNVLVANNSVGKSVFFKMLSITACPENYDSEDRYNLIQWGKPFAQILFSFSDGMYAATRVMKDRVLFYFSEDGNQFQAYAKAPDIMLQHLGLLVDRSGSFLANLIDSDHAMLLVNSNEKSNHNLLKMITENETLNDFQELLNRKLLEFGNAKLRVSDKLRMLESQIASYEYVDVQTLEEQIDNCETLFHVIYQITAVLAELENILHYTRKTRDYDSLLYVTSLLMKGIQCNQLITQYRIPAKYNHDLLYLAQISEIFSNVNTALMEYKPPRISKEWAMFVLNILEPINRSIRELKTQPPEKNVEDLLVVCDDIACTMRIYKCLGDIVEHLMGAAKSAERLESISCEMRERNAVYSCGIYGEVYYDGKTCIPSNQ